MRQLFTYSRRLVLLLLVLLTLGVFAKNADTVQAADDDTGDAFYHFDVSLATSLSKLLELKLAWLLDHKTRPAFADLEKTDTSFLATVVAKF